MRFLLFCASVLTFTGCSTALKPGEIGNYQSLTDTSKANFYVKMKPKKRKLNKGLIYYSFYQNKVQKTEGNYVGKPLHGEYKEINFSGKLLVQGKYKNGLKNGEWLFYTDLGDVSKKLTYKNGDTISLVDFYEKGRIIKSITPHKTQKKIKEKARKKERRQEKWSFLKFNRKKNTTDSIPTVKSDTLKIEE